MFQKHFVRNWNVFISCFNPVPLTTNPQRKVQMSSIHSNNRNTIAAFSHKKIPYPASEWHDLMLKNTIAVPNLNVASSNGSFVKKGHGWEVASIYVTKKDNES